MLWRLDCGCMRFTLTSGDKVCLSSCILLPACHWLLSLSVLQCQDCAFFSTVFPWNFKFGILMNLSFYWPTLEIQDILHCTTARCLINYMKYSGFQVAYLMLAFLLQAILWVVFSSLSYLYLSDTLKIIYLFCPVFTIQAISCLLSEFFFPEVKGSHFTHHRRRFLNCVYFFTFISCFLASCP